MADTVERVTEENGLVPDIEGMERTAFGREKTIVDETPGWRSCRRVNPNRWCGRSKGQETGSLAMGDAARAPATSRIVVWAWEASCKKQRRDQNGASAEKQRPVCGGCSGLVGSVEGGRDQVDAATGSPGAALGHSGWVRHRLRRGAGTGGGTLSVEMRMRLAGWVPTGFWLVAGGPGAIRCLLRCARFRCASRQIPSGWRDI
ncbi:hypothetical protein VTJ04DRAFT_7689 [Mycothermus thermophilus]|uniref:uncharacterized protein n=1 Tax=Humicola insolens TaxID=85995 RepID=UPI0037433FAC